MDWIQQWQSKLNKQNGVAPLVRTGGSRHTGLAALPYRNIQPDRDIIVKSKALFLNKSVIFQKMQKFTFRHKGGIVRCKEHRDFM